MARLSTLPETETRQGKSNTIGRLGSDDAMYLQ